MDADTCAWGCGITARPARPRNIVSYLHSLHPNICFTEACIFLTFLENYIFQYQGCVQLTVFLAWYQFPPVIESSVCVWEIESCVPSCRRWWMWGKELVVVGEGLSSHSSSSRDRESRAWAQSTNHVQESVMQHHTGAQTEMMGFVLALQDLKCERHTQLHWRGKERVEERERRKKIIFTLSSPTRPLEVVDLFLSATGTSPAPRRFGGERLLLIGHRS